MVTIKIIILTFYFHITLYVSYDVFSLIHPSKRDILPPTLDNTISIFSPNFGKYDIRFDITISPDHVFYKTFFVFVVFSTLLTSGGWLIRLSCHDPSPAASQGTNSLAPAKATAEKYSLGRNQSVNIAREKTDQRRLIF